MVVTTKAELKIPIFKYFNFIVGSSRQDGSRRGGIREGNGTNRRAEV